MSLDKNKCCNLFWNARKWGLGLGCVQAAFKRQRCSNFVFLFQGLFYRMCREPRPTRSSVSALDMCESACASELCILGCPGNLPQWPLEHHLESDLFHPLCRLECFPEQMFRRKSRDVFLARGSGNWRTAAGHQRARSAWTFGELANNLCVPEKLCQSHFFKISECLNFLQGW